MAKLQPQYIAVGDRLVSTRLCQTPSPRSGEGRVGPCCLASAVLGKYRGRPAAPPSPPRKAGRVKRLFLRAVPQERRDVDVLLVGAELRLGFVLVLLPGEEGFDALSVLL